MSEAAAQAFASHTPVASAAEAQGLAAQFVEVMDALSGVIAQETDLVRVGRLSRTEALVPAKSDLTRLYLAGTLRLRANKARIGELVPELLADLARRHDRFRALLQTNLTVLATAHAVSEGIVRGVSGALARKSSPQTYGASGLANSPDPRAAPPLAVSRLL